MECLNIVSTVIDGISSFATVAAVIVALYANKKSNEQLLKALEMHEQSKSVELFEKRMECVRKVRTEHFPSEEDIAILFDSDVQEAFASLLQKKRNLNQYNKDLKQYDRILQHEYPKPEIDSPMALLKKAEWDWRNGDTKEFEKLCKKYERPIPAMLSHDGEKVYNYSQIIKKIDSAKKDVDSEYDKLLDRMLTFIKKSIEPLTKRGK